jgi:hypothetical protein
MTRDEIPAGAPVYVGWAGPTLLRESDIPEQPWRCHYYSPSRKTGGYWRCGNRGSHDGVCRHHIGGMVTVKRLMQDLRRAPASPPGGSQESKP